MPEPGRRSTKPVSSSRFSATRTVPRATQNCSAKARSGGSHERLIVVGCSPAHRPPPELRRSEAALFQINGDVARLIRVVAKQHAGIRQLWIWPVVAEQPVDPKPHQDIEERPDLGLEPTLHRNQSAQTAIELRRIGILSIPDERLDCRRQITGNNGFRGSSIVIIPRLGRYVAAHII